MDQREPGERAGASHEAPGRITPMMEQYIEIRAANPDCLLFYRMGDFYELFFGDAEIASRALGITLTKRGKHLGDDIPMCGVPIHAADDYLQKLIGLGHRVAVCEQTEDPAEARRRGGKSVVRRAVTRLVTPGTITEDRLLDAGRNNYLAALTKTAGSDGGDRHALAWVDISTGEFHIGAAGPGGLATLIGQVEPREVLVPERLAEEAEIRSAVSNISAALTPLPAAFFDAGSAEDRLCGVFGVKTMEAFGAFSRGELSAGAALIAYVDKTQIAKRPPIEPPRRVLSGEIMRLDAATKANLEIFRTISGSRAGSLIAAVDRTRTAAGARLLVERLANPSCNSGLIEERLEAVEFFLEKAAFRCALGAMLGACPDVLRAMARVGLDRGGPRDLAALRSGLQAALGIRKALEEQPVEPGLVARQQEALANVPADLVDTLDRALADDLPLLKRDGGFIKRGFDQHLDEARALRDESRKVIASLQARYAGATGIRSLKIRHNNVLGYFVEVTAGQAASLSGNGAAEKFIHRQTLASAIRFSTTELGDLEQKIASAAERALAIELEIFADLAAGVAGEEPKIRAAARALAEIDVASALAELAASENYVRPQIEAGLAFEIVGGRHPVVEQALRAEGASFVGNDCGLGPEEETLPLPAAAQPPSRSYGEGYPSPSRFAATLSPDPKRDVSRFGIPDGEVGNTRLRMGEGEEGDQLPLAGSPPHPVGGPLPPLAQAQAAPSPDPKRGVPRFGNPDGEVGNTRLRVGEGSGKIWLITGPNMAGKSTFLRQNALIAILAQAGSFVPAKAARIGIVDAVFSRVGAADDLARGRSTFMVEMVETAAILNQAGPRALVILDEIGRGTATFDGLSIAWAVIEHLHEENRCRTLFATHYHELTALSAKLGRVTNATMKVKEWNGDVVFLHEIVPGAADRSYGIQVAKLAGLPAGVIKRAKSVLESLEKSDRSRPKAMIDDLPLFAVKAAEPAEAKASPALAALDEIVPDELSPKEALERLYQLKRLRREEGA